MSHKVKKWLTVILISAVALFLINQLYQVFYNPFTTQTVQTVSYYDGVDALGMVVRDEKVVTADVTGVISYPLNEGSRVAKGNTVANLFRTAKEADAYLSALKIADRIETLKDTQTYNDLYAADVSLLDTKIVNSLCTLLDDRQGSRKIIASTAENELTDFLNRKQIVTGSVTDFNDLIAAFTTQKASSESVYTGHVSAVKAEESGYFISVVDGYESVLSLHSLKSLTAEKLAAVKPNEVPAGAVCKIVTDYRWYIAAEVPYEYSLTLAEGKSMTLRTAIKGYTELPVTVSSVNRDDEAGTAVAVFMCKIMNEHLAGLRILPVTIIKESYKGLRVDSRALRVQEGKQGVFVRSGNQILFVPVNILFNGKFAIAEQEVSEERRLRLYDEIVVKGKDLYDGKIIE